MTDIVSPITDKGLPPRTSPADAAKAGRVAYDKPTPKNTVFLFIDHQIGLMAGVRDFRSLAEYKSTWSHCSRRRRSETVQTCIAYRTASSSVHERPSSQARSKAASFCSARRAAEI